MTRRLRPDELAAWERMASQIGKPAASRKPRQLAPDEEDLWGKVAATVRPLEKKTAAPSLPRVKAMVEVRAETALPGISRSLANLSVSDATLDAVWDRKIRTGEILPDLVIDLHGHSRDAAYAVLERQIRRAHERRARVVLIVTGKGQTGAPWPSSPRGVLREELPRWLDQPGLRPFVAALRPAHQRHGGLGAFYAILRRSRGEPGQG